MIMSNEAYLEKAKEIQKSFTYDTFEIARTLYFSHQQKPALTIRSDSITFNASCINTMEEVVYVQILVSKSKHRIAVRRCDANDKDAIRWCIQKPDKRKSRRITSRIFSDKIYQMMGWERNHRYKMIGYLIEHEGEELFVFELDEAEFFEEKAKKKDLQEAERLKDPVAAQQAEERKRTRTPHFPEEWKDSFGVPVGQHGNVSLGTIDSYGSYGDFNASQAAQTE